MKTLKNTLLLLLISIATLSNAQNTSYSLLASNTIESDTHEMNYELSMYVPESEFNTSNINYAVNISPHKNRGSGFGGELGVGLLAAGAAFLIGGLTTQVPYEGHNGPDKPFFQQGPRMVAIISGGMLFTAGLVITISQ